MAGFLATAPILAQSPDRARTESLARRASARLRALQHEADTLAAQERTLLVELRRLDVERAIRAEELKRADAELATIATALTDSTANISRLEAREQSERPGLEARLVEIYKLGNAGYVRMLFNANDLRSFGRAYRTVSAIARLDRERVEEHRQNLRALRDAHRVIEQRRIEIAAFQEDARRARAGIEQAVRSRERLVTQIDERRDLNAQLAGELQLAQQKLQQTLTNIAAGRPAATDAVTLPFKAFRGDIDWPAQGAISGRFGRNAAPRYGTAVIRNGIEITALAGGPVRAVSEGTVAFADPFTGFGNLVIVDHGGQAYSLYGHLASIAVTKGARVDRGQMVGTVGAAPTGPPGLYFELRIDGKPVDPVQWLKVK